jgi:hypothetical protein
MSYRSNVDFNEQVGPLFRKYAATYGVKNICSLGIILVDRMQPDKRELLMTMIGEGAPIETIRKKLDEFAQERARAIVSLASKSKRRITAE